MTDDTYFGPQEANTSAFGNSPREIKRRAFVAFTSRIPSGEGAGPSTLAVDTTPTPSASLRGEPEPTLLSQVSQRQGDGT